MKTLMDGDLSFKERSKILKGVILGGSLPQDASPAAVAWRRQCEKDVAAIRAQGMMPEIPFDPTFGDEDDAPPPPAVPAKPKHTGTELASELVEADAERSVDFEEYKYRVKTAAEAVAGELGVTPMEALESHIDPTTFLPWRPKREAKPAGLVVNVAPPAVTVHLPAPAPPAGVRKRVTERDKDGLIVETEETPIPLPEE